MEKNNAYVEVLAKIASLMGRTKESIQMSSSNTHTSITMFAENLVYINNTKEFREISSYNSDRFDDLFGKGWEAACRMFGIYKWAYKDDLLPKKGDE